MSRSTSKSRGSTPSAETRLAATSTHSLISKGGAAPRRVDPNTIPRELNWLARIHASLKKDPTNLPPDYGEVRRIRFLENLRPLTIFNNSMFGAGATKIRTGNLSDPRRRNPKGGRLGTQSSYQNIKGSPAFGFGDGNWIQAHMDDIPDAIPETCKWIFDQPKFMQWRASTNDVLLLVGDLATGKSVLAKSLCQRLAKDAEAVNEGEIVVPFFCQADSRNRNTIQSIFASWIYHLLSCDKDLGRYVTDGLVDAAHNLSFFELWMLFCEFVEDDETKKWIFIIDSLDQCDKKSQLDLKNLLSVSAVPQHAKIFITSRPLKYLNGLGTQLSRIDVDVNMLSDDIEVVLHHEIRRRSLTDIFSEELIEFVCNEIKAIVQGMFDFIGAKLDELNVLRDNPDFQTSREFLHEFFTKPPEFLEDYYTSELLPKISSNKSRLDEVASVLSILLVMNQDAMSELELKKIFKVSRASFSESTVAESVHNSLDFVDNVSRICGPLIRYRKDNTGIRWLKIAHPIAKNFVVKKRDPKSTDELDDFFARVNLEKGHSELAQACLRHLMTHSNTSFELTLSPKDLFLEYSLKNWSTHVRESHRKFRVYEELLAKFLSSNSEGYEKWSDFARLSRNEFGTVSRWWEKPLPIICAIVSEGLTNVLDTAVKTSDPGYAVFANSLLVNVDELDDSGRSALLIAMERNDFHAASKLLELGASVQISNSDLPTPLHLAVSKENKSLVSSLLEQGADVDVEAPMELTALPQSSLLLSVAGTMAIFRTLLDSQPRRFVRSRDGWSLLHEAARHGDIEKVSHILSLNILDVDQKTNDGYSPLMVAAGVTSGHDVTKLLIESSAELDLEASDGSTAIYEAAYHGNLRTVVLLRQKGSVSLAGKNGETNLMAAISKGHNDIFRHLISRKVGINVKSHKGDTALMFGVRYQHSNFVQQLLRAGAETNTVNTAGETALLIASSGTRPEIVQSLLRYCSNPAEASKWSRESWSCLHEAAFWGRLEIVKRLIAVRESSADIEEVFAKRSWTPLLVALRSRHDDVARYLLECGAKTDVKSDTGWTALHMVCFYSSDENLLLEILRRSPKSYLSAVTDKGSTPLSLAAEEGHAGLVRILMAKPGVRTVIRNSLGNTPLHYAADIGSNETVKVLMEAAFEADIRSHFGWTALHAACKRCSREVVEKLVKVTNWAFKYRQGLTPLHVAIENANDEAFFALLDAGLPATLPSGWGSPPLLHAAAAGNMRYVAHLLLDHADVDSFNWVNYLPIHGAYSCRDAVMAKSLRPSHNLALRLSINTLDSLANAAASISLEEVEWAAKYGMRISTRNAINETPLSRACENGLVDVVKYLLELDAEDVWLQKEAVILLTGWTPLHIAARFRQAECISVLAQDGYIDAFVEDCFGFTAFDYAYGDVPSWLALVKCHEISMDQYVPRHKYLGLENQVDLKQLLAIVEWRLSKLRDSNNQFDEADAHLASFVLVDPLLRLQDEQNALTAIEIYLGEPSFRLNAGVSCQICAKTRNARVFVCKSCPFRLVCNDCKDITQRTKLKGCFLHDFIQVPSESWFSRDARHVNKDEETEERWLESVQKKYEATNREYTSDVTCTPLNLGSTCKAADVFRECGRFTHLIDHLHEHPRDIGVKDDEGRNITMHVLEIASADESCLHNLQKLATEGAKLLVYDNHKISSIKIASDKGFERSLNFLLEQWDPDFDRSEDMFSSKTVQSMIEHGWMTALNLAIERHFDWIARDKYHYLRQLSGMGINRETMIDKLISEAAESKIGSPARDSDGPWAYFEPPVVRNEPQLEGHVTGCIHSVVANQISQGRELPDATALPEFFADDGTYESKWSEYDRKQGMKSYWQMSKPGFGSAIGERPSTPSDFSDFTNRTQDFDRSFAFVDMVQEATALCGIGGLFPNSDPTVIFPGADDHAPDRELVISYKSAVVDPTIDRDNCIKILKRGGHGLRNAFARAQDAQLCCSWFSILHKTSLSAAEGHPVVKLVDIPLALAGRFVSELDNMDASVGEGGQETCATIARAILGIPLSVDQAGAEYFESPMHCCALALQFLCLGFVSFLMGHRSSSPIPILATHVSAFRLIGIEQGFGMKLAPVQMACIGNMLEDQLYAFSILSDAENQSREISEDIKPTAYLLAKVEDLLEIWGPPICIPERSSNGESTGRILAVEICNGRLTLTGDDDNNGKRYAHWEPLWEDRDDEKALEGFLVSEEVLIGALEENRSCSFNAEHEWQRANDDQLLTPLLTRSPRWIVIQRSTQASLSGPHVGISGSQTWGLERGLLMKRNVVKQWERGFGLLNMLNKPFGVVVSLCTGFAERVPLRVAIAQVMDAYLAQFTPPQSSLALSDMDIVLAQNELHAFLTGFGCRHIWQGNRRFSDYITHVRRQRRWEYVRELVLFILLHLEASGYDKHRRVFRIAWADERDPANCFELPCAAPKAFRWLRMMEDSIRSATFAVATGLCLVAHRHPQAPYGFETCLRRQMIRQAAPHPYGVHLLHTTIVPWDATASLRRTWPLRRGVWYKIRAEGEVVKSRLSLLQPRHADGPMLFLLVIEATDHLINPMDSVMTALDRREYVLEKGHEEFPESSADRIHIIRWADWEGRDDIGDDIF